MRFHLELVFEVFYKGSPCLANDLVKGVKLLFSLQKLRVPGLSVIRARCRSPKISTLRWQDHVSFGIVLSHLLDEILLREGLSVTCFMGKRHYN